MNYQNYFPQSYYQNTYGQPSNVNVPYVPAQQQSQAQTQNNNSIIWVQGESGAKSYLVAPNQSVVLWDTESQTIYVKSADASGMPSIKALDYTMRESAPQTSVIPSESSFASKDDVDYLKKEIEALKGKFEDKESKKK